MTLGSWSLVFKMFWGLARVVEEAYGLERGRPQWYIPGFPSTRYMDLTFHGLHRLFHTYLICLGTEGVLLKDPCFRI